MCFQRENGVSSVEVNLAEKLSDSWMLEGLSNVGGARSHSWSASAFAATFSLGVNNCSEIGEFGTQHDKQHG